jgi:hypothetical protein
LEGVQSVIAITVERDLMIFPGKMVLEFATSDITARGIDQKFFDYCMSLGVGDRARIGCGDYEQSAGYITFEEGVASGGFEVRIMDDLCYEKYNKLIQLTLSVPGSSVLSGEKVEATIRIDDDDFGSQHPCRDPTMYDPLTQHPFKSDGFWFPSKDVFN